MKSRCILTGLLTLCLLLTTTPAANGQKVEHGGEGDGNRVRLSGSQTQSQQQPRGGGGLNRPGMSGDFLV